MNTLQASDPVLVDSPGLMKNRRAVVYSPSFTFCCVSFIVGGVLICWHFAALNDLTSSILYLFNVMWRPTPRVRQVHPINGFYSLHRVFSFEIPLLPVADRSKCTRPRSNLRLLPLANTGPVVRTSERTCGLCETDTHTHIHNDLKWLVNNQIIT